MSWLKSYQELGQHPKLLRLTAKLGISRAQAVGHLHYLWWWALTYAERGDLSQVESAEIAAAAAWDGDPQVFVAALASARFLDGEPGAYSLHDWADYEGRFIEQRKQTKERVRRYRERNADVTRDVTASNAYRGEKRRIEKNRGEKNTPAAIGIAASPSSFTGQFVEFYEKDIGVLTPTIIEHIKTIEAEEPEIPPYWAVDVIAEACDRGVRKWSYIEAILNSWIRNGKPPKDTNHA